MTAPQAKMNRKIKKGMIDQVSSRSVEPSICSARTPGRRLYFTANTTIKPKMAMHTNEDSSSRKTYSASTFAAPLEACGGQSGKFSNIAVGPVLILARLSRPEAEQDPHHPPDEDDGRDSRKLQNPRD